MLSRSRLASRLPRGDYGCGHPAPKNLEELKLMDFKEDLKCGFYRGEIRNPHKALEESSDEEDDADLENVLQAERDRVEAEERDRLHRQRKKEREAKEDDEHAMQKSELLREKKRLLCLTPLHYAINKQQREEILEALEIWHCQQLSQSKLVESGSRCEALYMVVEGTCSVHMALKDGQNIDIQRSVGSWFPYPMALDTAAPYDLVATPGSTFLVIRGTLNFKRLVQPVIKHSTVDYVGALTSVFKELSHHEIVRLLAISNIEDARKDHMVIREGHMSSSLALMVRGNCMMTKSGSRLSVVASPHLFGQVSIYHDLPNPVSVRTTAPAKFILIPKRELLSLVQCMPGLKSVAQRLAIDSTAGLKWLFQRSKDTSIAPTFGGNTTVAIEDSRQRNLIARVELGKGKNANASWSGDEPAKSLLSATPEQQLLKRQDTLPPRRPQSAMELTRASNVAGDGLSGEAGGRADVPDLTQELGRTSAEDRGPGRPRPQSAMLMRTGLKEGMDGADQTSAAQATGPFSRFVSANMAKEEIMEYLAQSRRRGVSLRHNKEEKLEEESLRFLKQSDMKLESGSSALTNAFIHRVERSLMARSKNNAQREAIRRFKESADPTTVGNRHGVLRDRLERTMNKGTAAALRWAKNKVGTDD